MSFLRVPALLFGAISLLSTAAFADQVPHLEPDELITYEQARSLVGAREGAISTLSSETRELLEMVRIGGRAVQWVDIFQADVPLEQREQIWRRSDRLGHEPTAANPMVYNPEIIRRLWSEAIALTSPGTMAVLSGTGELPATLPEDTDLQGAMTAIRKIHTAYSRASRWITLLQWRSQLGKASRDLRPWIRLRDQKEALLEDIRRWETLDKMSRKRIAEQIVSSCAIAGMLTSRCRVTSYRLVDSGSAAAAEEWFSDVFKRGQVRWDRHFGVTRAHPGVQVTQDGPTREIKFFTKDIPQNISDWIQEQVTGAWDFPQATRLVLEPTSNFFQVGAVEVEWVAGTTPHVNGVGGNTITMDANTALWLEHTRIVMAHEFGHVIGFPDCYVEFWDEDIESFVFYTLDPEDRMCALSGNSLDRHREALLRAFVNR